MKSFQLYRLSPLGPVNGHYPPAETTEYQRQFEPMMKPYWKKRRRRNWAMLGAVLLVVCGFKMINEYVVLAGASLFIFVDGGMRLVLPPCPACQQPLEGEPKKFCPECGNQSFPAVQKGWDSLFECCHCQRKIVKGRRGRNRIYRIRVCTHCGLLVDKKGL